MREIKFRAWDKDTSRMYYEPEKHKHEFYGDILTTREYFEVMQYTGLKDKNGKEIYESDIVKVSGFLNAEGVVKYVDGSFLVETFNGKNGWYLFSETNENEVIGNIYENPELIKD